MREAKAARVSRRSKGSRRKIWPESEGGRARRWGEDGRGMKERREDVNISQIGELELELERRKNEPKKPVAKGVRKVRAVESERLHMEHHEPD
jgi:hypothetical protein